MKVTISKQALNKAVQAVNKIVDQHAQVTVLKGIKIETMEDGILVTSSSTNLMIQYLIPNKSNEQENIYIDSPGLGVLYGQLFNEYVKRIVADEIEIAIDEKHQGKIRGHKTDLKINGYDPIEFPDFPQFFPEQSLRINSRLLAQLVRQTVFAVSTNQQSPILNGVLFSLVGGKLKLTATDRHRLATVNCTIQSEAEFQQIVVSSEALQELLRLLPENEIDVDIMFKDNQIMFKFGQIMLYSKLLDGTYPDTEKIVQNASNYSTELVLTTELLLSTMERAAIMSSKDKGNVVNMHSIDSETLEINVTQVDYGRFKETIATSKPLQNAIRVAFNTKFILDILKVTDSDYVIIGFTGDMNPIYIQPQQQPDEYIAGHLILPYRTSRGEV